MRRFPKRVGTGVGWKHWRDSNEDIELGSEED
jgi:hypothetical protein